MPSRNQSMIRRDINRLRETIERHQADHPALAAILILVATAADAVNTAWQTLQAAVVSGDKERDERDNAISALTSWVQSWRPVLLLSVPGADVNLRNLPATGATPDDMIRLAEDMAAFINANPAAESFREAAITALDDNVATARQETSEATAALPAETAARQAYTDACNNANTILVRGTEVIRATFGRTSPEYKQFIARASAAEEQEIDEEVEVGES